MESIAPIEIYGLPRIRSFCGVLRERAYGVTNSFGGVLEHLANTAQRFGPSTMQTGRAFPWAPSFEAPLAQR